MTINTIHASLSHEALGHPLTDDDEALALMLLLHTHRISLCSPVLTDRPCVVELAAITQRHAAELVASLWARRSDLKEVEYRHWYWEFNTRTPFQSAEDIAEPWLQRVKELRARFASHPAIARIEPED